MEALLKEGVAPRSSLGEQFFDQVSSFHRSEEEMYDKLDPDTFWEPPSEEEWERDEEERSKYYKEKRDSKGYDITSSYGHKLPSGIRVLHAPWDPLVHSLVQFAIDQHNAGSQGVMHEGGVDRPLYLVQALKINYLKLGNRSTHYLITLLASNPDKKEEKYHAEVCMDKDGMSLAEFRRPSDPSYRDPRVYSKILPTLWTKESSSSRAKILT